MSTSWKWWESFDDSERLNEVEDFYTRRLLYKYFSGNLPEVEAKIGNDIVKSNSWKAYINPIVGCKITNDASALTSGSPHNTIGPNAENTPVSVPAPTERSFDLNVAIDSDVEITSEDPIQSFDYTNVALSVERVSNPSLEGPSAGLASGSVPSFKDPHNGSTSVRRARSKRSKRKYQSK